MHRYGRNYNSSVGEMLPQSNKEKPQKKNKNKNKLDFKLVLIQ